MQPGANTEKTKLEVGPCKRDKTVRAGTSWDALSNPPSR